MNKRIWTFGDSFTYGFGCRPDCDSGIYETIEEYKQPDDDIWPNLVSKKLNIPLRNLGKSGYSNDRIIDSVIDFYNQINKGDIVIIGMTNTGRNQFAYNSNWYPSFSIDEMDKLHDGVKEQIDDNLVAFAKDLSKEIKNTIINFQYYFSEDRLYKEQQYKRFNFLRKRLLLDKKVDKCFLWDKEIRQRFSTLSDEFPTMNDLHFGFKGHRDFSKYIYRRVKTELI